MAIMSEPVNLQQKPMFTQCQTCKLYRVKEMATNNPRNRTDPANYLKTMHQRFRHFE